MMITTKSVVLREFVHWMLLWAMATLVICGLQQRAGGQGMLPRFRLNPTSPKSSDQLDQRDGIKVTENATLRDVLALNESGAFEHAITAWQQLDVAQHSHVWKNVGIGAAHLHLNRVDQSLEQFNRAVRLDSQNAVAEYFLARAYQAKSRQVPLWHERIGSSPFRFAALNQKPTQDEAEMNARGTMLPQYKTIPLEKLAKHHFRRAIQLASLFDLDREIEIIQPRVRLVQYGQDPNAVTIRDLLRSLDEEDFVAKARLEIAERLVSQR